MFPPVNPYYTVDPPNTTPNAVPTPNAPHALTKPTFNFLMVVGGGSILGGLLMGLLLYVLARNYPRSSRETQRRMKFWFAVMLAITVVATSYVAGAFSFVSNHPVTVFVVIAIIAVHSAIILGPVRRAAAAVSAPRRRGTPPIPVSPLVWLYIALNNFVIEKILSHFMEVEPPSKRPRAVLVNMHVWRDPLMWVRLFVLCLPVFIIAGLAIGTQLGPGNDAN